MEMQVAVAYLQFERSTPTRRLSAKKGPPPAPLDSKITKKLLDLLSTDNDFRRLFKKDAQAALAKIGYKIDAGATSACDCMQLRTGDRIASKTKIARIAPNSKGPSIRW